MSLTYFKDGQWRVPGGLIAVKHVLKTDTETLTSVPAGGSAAVTGLSITHELADPSHRLLISAFFGAASVPFRGQVGIAIHDGTNLINIGDTDGVRTSVTAGGYIDGANTSITVTMPSFTYIYSPGSGSKTYTVHAININVSSQTIRINREIEASDVQDRTRAVSGLVIQEISV